MAVGLSTRSGTNVVTGAVAVYMADAGSITLETAYGASMTLADFATLLGGFEIAGSIEKDPAGGFDPIEYDMVDSNGNEGKGQIASTVKLEIDLQETDNTLVNALLALAEARTQIDVIVVRNTGLAVGDRATFYRSVYFTVAKMDKHSHEAPDLVHLKIEMKVKNVKSVHGQWQMIANP